MPRQRRPIPWLKIRDGVYYVYWYDGESGRTKRLSLGTEEAVEAQTRYAAFLSGGHASFGPQAAAGVTVANVLDDYWREHVGPNVVDKKRAEDIIGHLKAWFTSTLIKDIDIPACRAYADARRKGVVGGGKCAPDPKGSDSTIRRELSVLSAAAHHARRWKRISAAEMPSIERPQEAPHREAWLTKLELAQAIAMAPQRLQDFMMLAYYTGARRGSIEHLTRFQVDLANSRINLSSPKEDANQRRSVKRRPVVPIDPALRPVIERLLLEHPGSEYLFGTPSDMYAPFRTHMEGMGLTEKAHPHILRHTRATHLLQDGVDLYAVARLLGDTVATVERVYGHHSPDYLAEAIRGKG